MHEIVELYPTIRLRWDPGNEMIRSLLAINHDYNNDIEYFLKVQCREFPGKTLRTHTRRDLHFNVLIAENAEALDNNPTKSVTVDVSEGGCFVYSTGNWEIGQTIYFIFNEIDNCKAITGTVRQIKNWGEKMRFPGLGVQFQQIEPSQKEIIDNWRNNK